MTNMLRGLTDKVENMQEQMSISVSREVEILKKYQKIMLGIKNKAKQKTTGTEMKNPFDGLIVDWTWLRKELLSLRISQ